MPPRPADRGGAPRTPLASRPVDHLAVTVRPAVDLPPGCVRAAVVDAVCDQSSGTGAGRSDGAS